MCEPVWWNDPLYDGLGAITCLSCVLARQDCSFRRADWNIEYWPKVIKTGVGRALREMAAGPGSDNGPGEGSSTGGEVPDREVCAVLRHLNDFEAHLQDPAQTVVSLQTHRAQLREVHREEEHGATALRALVDDRKPIIERLVQMFDQAVEKRGQEATGGGKVGGNRGGDKGAGE